MPSLFDLSAFAPNVVVGCVRDGRWVHGNKEAKEEVHESRRGLRNAVLFDISKLVPSIDQLSRSYDEAPSILQRAVPPWPNVFVNIGQRFTGKNADLGQHIATFDLLDADTAVIAPDGMAVPEGSAFMCIAKGWSRIGSRVIANDFNTGWFLNQDGKFLSWMNQGDGGKLGVSICLVAFQVSHCRNVITKENEAHRPFRPRGMRRRCPKVKYYTLEMDCETTKQITPAGDAQAGVSKHICRGHFAHYTEEKPMFGKYTGTFWVPMHIRGSAKHGIVGKDYSLRETDSNVQ